MGEAHPHLDPGQFIPTMNAVEIVCCPKTLYNGGRVAVGVLRIVSSLLPLPAQKLCAFIQFLLYFTISPPEKRDCDDHGGRVGMVPGARR